jgi:hypothetical protein
MFMEDGLRKNARALFLCLSLSAVSPSRADHNGIVEISGDLRSFFFSVISRQDQPIRSLLPLAVSCVVVFIHTPT